MNCTVEGEGEGEGKGEGRERGAPLIASHWLTQGRYDDNTSPPLTEATTYHPKTSSTPKIKKEESREEKKREGMRLSIH